MMREEKFNTLLSGHFPWWHLDNMAYIRSILRLIKGHAPIIKIYRWFIVISQATFFAIRDNDSQSL